MRKPMIPALAACLALLLVAGCSSDDPSSTEPDFDLIPPHDPDFLMEDFARAYGEMDLNAYEAVLHEDYKFVFADGAVVWDREQDFQSTTNMFTGEPGNNPDGTPRPPIQSILIDTLIRQTPWEDVPADDPDFPNSVKALYQVRLVFTHTGGVITITMDSDQVFFVKPEEIDLGDGTLQTRYFLYGHQERSGLGLGANEAMTWGEIKALYY